MHHVVTDRLAIAPSRTNPHLLFPFLAYTERSFPNPCVQGRHHAHHRRGNCTSTLAYACPALPPLSHSRPAPSAAPSFPFQAYAERIFDRLYRDHISRLTAVRIVFWH